MTGVRHREEELRRAFFSARFVRVLDSLGYARFKNWRLYGEEALAGSEAVLWLASESLTLEHRGEALARKVRNQQSYPVSRQGEHPSERRIDRT